MVEPSNLGLSSKAVKELRLKYGDNKLPEKGRPTAFKIFLSQLRNPLIYILLGSAAATFVIEDYTDTLIILFTVAINTVMGYFQERRASDALYALKSYVVSHSTVFRDGARVKIATEELVPGDIVVLAQGTKVPADGKLLQINRLYLDESILTGESSPVQKKEGDEVYLGSTIATGQAIMQVTGIGASTKMGEIASRVQDEDEGTPLQRQLQAFSRSLIKVVAVLVTVVFVVGLLYGQSLREIFTTAVALTVSSIPEGLIVSLTVVLALGMQKMYRNRALVKKLAAVETLGGVTVICVDKTGTITEGKMEVVASMGDKKELARQVSLANDLDDPIVIAAFSWAKHILGEDGVKAERLDSIPFSSRTRRFLSLHKEKRGNVIYVNGAPELLLSSSNLSAKEREEIQAKIEFYTGKGYRLLGLASQAVSSRKVKLSEKDAKRDLTWRGILAFSDPVRAEVEHAIKNAETAGIRSIVITGDYARTSAYILRSVGIKLKDEEIVTGDELVAMTEEELVRRSQKVKLFARTTPDQKLRIVNSLRANGEVVAMMGDGVNDAPALHSADIGIAVGEATDVAKESADLVLLDSNFATITKAVEEGRGIFENIRKIILYLMSDAFTEIIVVLVSILLGFPPALIAVQILWINIGSDSFPSLALTLEPTRPGVMKELPRSKQEPLITRWMINLIAIISLIAGTLAVLSFLIVYHQTGDLLAARSMAFITLGLDTLLYVFSVRSLLIPFWRFPQWGNPWLIISVFVGLLLQILPFTTPTLRAFFGVTTIPFSYWLYAAGAAMVSFLAIETFKHYYLEWFAKERIPRHAKIT